MSSAIVLKGPQTREIVQILNTEAITVSVILKLDQIPLIILWVNLAEFLNYLKIVDAKHVVFVAVPMRVELLIERAQD